MTRPSVTIETISPLRAKEYLGRIKVGSTAGHQRKFQPRAAEKYAKIIERGEFHLTNDAVVFDTDGRLINGQTRLGAVMLSGKSQQFIVARDFDPDSFLYMDRQRSRTLSQFLHCKYANTVASCANLVTTYFSTGKVGSRAGRPEPYESMVTLETWGESLINAAEVVHRSRAPRTVQHAAFLAFSYWLFTEDLDREHDKGNIERFLTEVATGEQIKKGDPSYGFREAYLALQKKRMTPSPTRFEAAWLTALDDHLDGTEAPHKYKFDGVFPELMTSSWEPRKL